MGNDLGAGQTTVSGASGETAQFGPVEGVLEDAHGNRLNFRLTVASSGPRVIGPPPRRFRVELTCPELGITTIMEQILLAPE